MPAYTPPQNPYSHLAKRRLPEGSQNSRDVRRNKPRDLSETWRAAIHGGARKSIDKII
jgi:hypothetical protein